MKTRYLALAVVLLAAGCGPDTSSSEEWVPVNQRPGHNTGPAYGNENWSSWTVTHEGRRYDCIAVQPTDQAVSMECFLVSEDSNAS